MNLTFDKRIILLLYTLMQGLAGLRLNKVSIPAYKLRGESAFLECQYELSRPNYVSNTHSSNKDNKHTHNQHGGGGGGGDLNYIDTESAGTDEMPVYRRSRTFPYSQQQQQQQHQQQQQQHHQQQQNHQQQQHHCSAGGGGYYQSQYQRQYPEEFWSHAGHQRTHDDSNAKRKGSDSRGHETTSYASGRRVGASTHSGGTVTFDHHLDRDDVNMGEMGGIDDSEELNDGSEALYAVKWYKDNEEFYRYVPKAKPPKQSYRVDGIRVIEEHTDSTRILLRVLTLNSTGSYRCEISDEAPNFSSVQGEGRMDIVSHLHINKKKLSLARLK